MRGEIGMLSSFSWRVGTPFPRATDANRASHGGLYNAPSPLWEPYKNRRTLRGSGAAQNVRMTSRFPKTHQK